MITGPITRRRALVGAVASAAALSVSGVTTAAADGTVHDVTIKSFAFDPAHVKVRIGDKIRWTNQDLAPHTATADGFGWDTEELTQGKIGEIEVKEGMETSYFCAFHPRMKGLIEIL